MDTTGFPSTIPAMTMTLEIGVPMLVGSICRGTPLTVVPITGGKLISYPTFSISIDASFVGTGNDYIHNDPSGNIMRLDTHAVVRDRTDDLIAVKYKGVIEVTPALSAILAGSAHARSTEFGNQFISVEFETGCERYKELEVGLFVGCGRFVVDEKRGRVSVEYRIGRMVSNVQIGRKDVAVGTEDGG